MPIIPALKPLFEAINSGSGNSAALPLDESRAQSHRALESLIVAQFGAAPNCFEQDIIVPVSGGSIRLRLYVPYKHNTSQLPCHVYFHGGGFWLGKLEHFDIPCRRIACAAGCAVISVEYRLAPENKFPTALQDCYAALVWVNERASDLGIDPQRISVGGLSAGGNFAAVVSIIARDRGGPPITIQVLECPVTDLSRNDSLVIENEGLIVPAGKDAYCRYYLSNPAEAIDAMVSPLLASDLSELPPALITCAEFDPLAAEGKAYADRLEEAGVAVEYHLIEGQFHGSQQMAALIPNEAAEYDALIADGLNRAFRQPSRICQ